MPTGAQAFEGHELTLGTITTGAESDIDQVTMIARQMLGRWGMSETIGFVRALVPEGRSPFLPGTGETSEATQRILDEEVHQLIDAAQRDVTNTLSTHRARLETLAQALLEHETLDELDAYAAAQMPPRTADAAPSAVHPDAVNKDLASARDDIELDGTPVDMPRRQ